MKKVGVRVVRGPDWKWGNQDGGEGHVGTVENIASEHTVNVIWDSGNSNVYRVNHEGNFDLRILDNAPLGIVHTSVACDECKEQPVAGIRWKCAECDNFDLCSKCYHSDKHLNHTFLRILMESAERIPVGDRRSSKTIKAEGLFTGAKVSPGEHLERPVSGTGGGKIVSIEDKDETSRRSMAKVTWDNGSQGIYRVGFEGFMDLKCTTEGSGGKFYPDHLPKLGTFNQNIEYNNGDRVKVTMSVEGFKRIQEGHGGWNSDMSELPGQTGRVLLKRGMDLIVQYEDSHARVNPEAVVKVNSREGGVEDSGMSVLGGLLAALMAGLEEHTTDNIFNSVVKGDLNGVKEHITSGRFHPNVALRSNGHTPLMVACHEGHYSIAEYLLTKKANMEAEDKAEDTPLAFAVLGNKPEIVKLLLSKGANPNPSNAKGLTPLHLGVIKSNIRCIEELLKKADVNVQAKNGDTALHTALEVRCRESIQMLLDVPSIDLHRKNARGFNVLHWATMKENLIAVKDILTKCPILVDSQKEDGFSALHLAVFNDVADITDYLVNSGNANIMITTNGMGTPMHLAAGHANFEVIKILIDAGASLNFQDAAGDTPLHEMLSRDKNLNDPSGLLQKIREKNSLPEEMPMKFMAGCYMVQRGAGLEIKNEKGHLPEDLLKEYALGINLREKFKTIGKQRPVSPGRGQGRGQSVRMSSIDQSDTPVQPSMTGQCGICMDRRPNRVFSCGHVCCAQCSVSLEICHICRLPITSKQNLFL